MGLNTAKITVCMYALGLRPRTVLKSQYGPRGWWITYLSNQNMQRRRLLTFLTFCVFSNVYNRVIFK